MYIWKIDKLDEELIAGDLSEHETFKYLVAYTILSSLAMIQYSNPNQFDTWAGILAGLTALLGLFFIYKCNGGRDGKNIVIRYLSIGWVIFVRMFVLLMLPTMIIILTLQEIYMGGVPEESTSIDLYYLTFLEVTYVFWVAKHINYVARKTHA
jgi:hypothetical protein